MNIKMILLIILFITGIIYLALRKTPPQIIIKKDIKITKQKILDIQNESLFKKLSTKKNTFKVESKSNHNFSNSQIEKIVDKCNSYLLDNNEIFEGFASFLSLDCLVDINNNSRKYLHWLKFSVQLEEIYSFLSDQEKNILATKMTDQLKVANSTIQISVLSFYLEKYYLEFNHERLFDLKLLNEQYKKEIELLNQDFNSAQSDSQEENINRNKSLLIFYSNEFKKIATH